MELSLKRADVLARAALKMANETKYEASLGLSIYDPCLRDGTTRDEVEAARCKLMERHNLALALIETVYRIRQQLAEANMRHGISDALTRDKRLATEETRITTLLRAIGEDGDGRGTAVEIAEAEAQALRERPEADRYALSRQDKVKIALFGADEVNALRKGLKTLAAQRAEVNETLTRLNVSNRITLGAETIAVLRQAELLDA